MTTYLIHFSTQLNSTIDNVYLNFLLNYIKYFFSMEYRFKTDPGTIQETPQGIIFSTKLTELSAFKIKNIVQSVSYFLDDLDWKTISNYVQYVAFKLNGMLHNSGQIISIGGYKVLGI